MNAVWRGRVAASAVGVIAGLAMGWLLWGPKKTAVETYQPPVVQQDRSVIAERKPDPTAKPAHQIPRGAKVERVGHVVVQPTLPALPDATPPPSYQIDWTLADAKDGERMIFSSPDGTVVTAVDIPVVTAKSGIQLAHSFTTGYNPISKDALVAYSQKIAGPLDAGGTFVWQDRKPGLYLTLTVRW